MQISFSTEGKTHYVDLWTASILGCSDSGRVQLLDQTTSAIYDLERRGQATGVHWYQVKKTYDRLWGKGYRVSRVWFRLIRVQKKIGSEGQRLCV